MSAQPFLRTEPRPASYKRVHVGLAGRYKFRDNIYPCRAVEMSAGDVRLRAPVAPPPEERVVVQLDELGAFIGAGAQAEAEGFVLPLRLTAQQRSRLADRLTWLANRRFLELREKRGLPRVVPREPAAALTLPCGGAHSVTIRDLSAGGVCVDTPLRPAIGAALRLGQAPLVVLRHTENGFAGIFARPLERIDEFIQL